MENADGVIVHWRCSKKEDTSLSVAPGDKTRTSLREEYDYESAVRFPRRTLVLLLKTVTGVRREVECPLLFNGKGLVRIILFVPIAGVSDTYQTLVASLGHVNCPRVTTPFGIGRAYAGTPIDGVPVFSFF